MRAYLAAELEAAGEALADAGQILAAERAFRAARAARDDIERVRESVRELTASQSTHETFHYRARLAGFDEPTEAQRKAAQFCVDFDLASKGGK